MEKDIQQNKGERALNEEATLVFWQENNIFEKSVEKKADKGDFIFYEGPPTANAKPALHHLEARAFKDVIPRYKTMQGYSVRRRAGWDTHGLPVELQIEKKLGFTSKKDIEEYGVAKFNKECKDSVFTHIKDWEYFTDRMGYWVDKDDAYYTFDNSYIESLWGIVGKINDRGLLYKDYRVTPWCARCGTTLATHELAQGYMDVKDLSVYAKFKIIDQENTFILAWTTTPWTLPGNVALAVGKDIYYVKIKVGEEFYILAQEKLSLVLDTFTIVDSFKGSDLVGTKYEPIYPYLKNELENKGIEISKAFQVYDADFVTTTDGTGVVHTAVMYGQEDFELGTKIGLPKLHTVDESGHFLSNMDFLSGRFVKDEQVAIDIIKDLAHRGLLFKKEKYEHSYPHCWRCKTPLIYYARDSWYVRMSELREDLLKANETINWEPKHIQQGRFGEWLREVKDWAFSRERYWGTPLPVWTSPDGKLEVVDSIEKLKSLTKSSGNKYFVMRHGQTDHNVRQEWNADRNVPDPMTELGLSQVIEVAKSFKEDVDIIITSPFSRTTETAKLFVQTKGWKTEIIEDERIREWEVGEEFNNKPFSQYFELRNQNEDRYGFKAKDGESYIDILIRAGEFIYGLEQKYQGKKILIITHGGIARALELHSHGVSFANLYKKTRDYKNYENADLREINFVPLPHNENFELDLHKPYIDEVTLIKDGQELKRVKEVIDVWFDSGSMPFAQDPTNIQYPADFISEAIDQTRGWFYTLLAVGVLMESRSPYKNVICLGHLLDKDGKKMSKSIGNIVEPYEQMDKFGVDAVRYWMYSVNQPGESKNYDEKSVAEINNKVFNLFGNVLSFYELYRGKELEVSSQKLEVSNVLDKWIIARLNQLISEVTTSLDSYDLFKPTRAIRDFIDDLSTWYLRRSRDRIRDGDEEAKQTLYTVLKTTAQLLAPFAPFFSENVWQKLKTEKDEESVHLSVWPTSDDFDQVQIDYMSQVREVISYGLEARQKENIKVRQPLGGVVLKEYPFVSSEMFMDYGTIIMQELNVEKLDFSRNGDGEKNAVLDTNITPELRRKGIARELMRAIQDMRKQKGLKPEDVIELTIGTNDIGKEVVEKFESDIKKTVGAGTLKVVPNDSGEINIEDISFSIKF
ncbi:MAG: class I tRNA ligase family protein [Candidatus Pacebacteria bacterium]|nr:class I tRNA ligase family protein [Candidatus Paceibacterota bacterium]